MFCNARNVRALKNRNGNPGGDHDNGTKAGHLLGEPDECATHRDVRSCGAGLVERFGDFSERTAEFDTKDNRIAVVGPELLQRVLVPFQRFPANRSFERRRLIGDAC